MAFPVILQTVNIGLTEIELFVPDEEAVKHAYYERKIAFPYWSKIWPSALALSEFIIQHPHYTKHKKVLELGAGLGLPSLVVARYAANVLSTDYVKEAVAISQQSATYHSLANFKTAVMDWRHLPNDVETDVLLLSDVNYEVAIFDELLQLVNDFLRRGTTILISTPQRLMAKDFINPLLQNVTQKEEIVVREKQDPTVITVLVLATIRS